MQEVTKFFNWYTKLGGDVSKIDVHNISERLNSATKENKRTAKNLKINNYKF